MNSADNWYKNFFNGLALEFWSKVMTSEYTNAEIKFIQQIIHIPHNAYILDVPCGNGRHSIALAQCHYHITSIDIAQEYINMLNAAKTKLQLPITAICADILRYQLTGSYDLALCLGNSFHYFSYP